MGTSRSCTSPWRSPSIVSSSSSPSPAPSTCTTTDGASSNESPNHWLDRRRRGLCGLEDGRGGRCWTVWSRMGRCILRESSVISRLFHCSWIYCVVCRAIFSINLTWVIMILHAPTGLRAIAGQCVFSLRVLYLSLRVLTLSVPFSPNRPSAWYVSLSLVSLPLA